MVAKQEAILVTAAFLLLAACAQSGSDVGPGQEPAPDSRSEIVKRIDYAWFDRTFVEVDLPNWREAAATANGFFNTELDRRWRPFGEQTATVVSQSRTLYVMAVGYAITPDEAYLDAVRSGADFLLARFRDEANHGWNWRVAPDGTLLERNPENAVERLRLYGSGFVILGLAEAYRVTGDARYVEAALDTREHISKDLSLSARNDDGWSTTGVDVGQKRYNVGSLLHLFEALLALHDVSGSQAVWDDIWVLAELMFSEFGRGRGDILPEDYDADWKPVYGEDGRARVNLGHLVEMAYFLGRAVEKGLPRRYLTYAERLLDNAMRIGYDRETGGLFTISTYDGKLIRKRGKDWWQQCELLRALMYFAVVHGRDDLWEPFHQTLAFVKDRFIDAEFGGWYRRPDAPTSREIGDANKGSGGIGRWKSGYHAAGMYFEAFRLVTENKTEER